MLDLSGNRLTALPRELPAGLTHLYLGDNPLAAAAGALGAALLALPALAALDVAYLGLPVKLGYEYPSDGTHVTKPAGCRLGPGAPPCAFTLQLYDSQNQPVKVGGLKPDLTLGADCETYQTRGLFGPATGRRNCRLVSPEPMADGGDGTYTAEVPPSWVPNTTASALVVGFFDGGGGGGPAAFFPAIDGAGAQDVSLGSVSLRTVAYGPVACREGTHTVPDPVTGARCICATGFVDSVVSGSSNATTLSCTKVCTGSRTGAACNHCPAGRYAALALAECRRCDPWAVCTGGALSNATSMPCQPGTQPDAVSELQCEACPSGRATPGGRRCERCGPSQEPVAAGTACGCVFGHYNRSIFENRAVQCLAQDLRSDAGPAMEQCVPCSTDQACVSCGAVMQTRPGWAALNESKWNIFSCPLDGACLGGATAACATGYTGTLCGVCAPGYDRIGRQSCKLCTAAGTSIAVIVLIAVGIGLAVWGVRWRLAQTNRAATADELVHSTINPAGGHYIQEEAAAAEEAAHLARQRKLGTLARVVYQPARIVIGFMQVVNHM